MYGLPKDFDPAVFVGRVVEMTCFTSNTINVHFDAGVSVTLEGSFLHSFDNGNDQASQTIPIRKSELMRLIGSQVIAGSIDPPGTLVLTFDSGDILKCLDDLPNYEAYTLRIGEREIIV